MAYRSGSILLYLLLLFFAPIDLAAGTSNRVPSAVPHCRTRYPSDDKIEWQCRRLKKGESFEKLFGDRWEYVARFNRMDRRHAYAGIYIKVPKDLSDVERFTPMPSGYAQAVSEPKFILINMSEQFLGAYEYGKLVFSAPVATGEKDNETPTGEFRITAFNRDHRSSKYFIENTGTPYPMHYALMFHISKSGVAYWMHGRDLPGHPASHGCIGLYDEEMQKKYYGYPKDPELLDSKMLYDWATGGKHDKGRFMDVKDEIRVLITGKLPAVDPMPRLNADVPAVKHISD